MSEDEATAQLDAARELLESLAPGTEPERRRVGAALLREVLSEGKE